MNKITTTALVILVTVLLTFAYKKYTQTADYIQVQPGAQEYVDLGGEYSGYPQQFYYSTPPCYQAGLSISLGGGFWINPGCNFVFNFGFYNPYTHPFPSHYQCFHANCFPYHPGFHGPSHNIGHNDIHHDDHHSQPQHHDAPHQQPHNSTPHEQPHQAPQQHSPPQQHGGGGGGHGGHR